MEIQCSNCGARQRFGVKYENVKSLIALGWNSVGSALYCPECVRTWASRNGDRQLWGKDNTEKQIMRISLSRLCSSANALSAAFGGVRLVPLSSLKPLSGDISRQI